MTQTCKCGHAESMHTSLGSCFVNVMSFTEGTVRGCPCDHYEAVSEIEPGTKVFLISGMKKKATHIEQVCTTYAIDGRWYWSDGTAVDGSSMRWEAANGPEK